MLANEGLLWGILIVGCFWVLPNVELTNLEGEPVGMADSGIRSDAVTRGRVCDRSCGLPCAASRHQSGHHLSMAPWAFFGGILGARLFFVIQYRDQFIGDYARRDRREYVEIHRGRV